MHRVRRLNGVMNTENVPANETCLHGFSESVSEATPEAVTIEAALPTANSEGRSQRASGRQTRDVVIEKIVTEEVML